MNEKEDDILPLQNTIEKYLKTPRKIIVLKEATSSNEVLKSMAHTEQEGTAVIVLSQTNGKGRMGRTFLSTDENGLYFSVLLKPGAQVVDCVKITAMAAVAVAQAIDGTARVQTQIKWVNDIFLNGKKICGILTEGAIFSDTATLDYAVLGIGINILPPKNGFDPVICEIAGSIFESTSEKDYKARLCAEIINRFFDYYDTGADYMNAYREKSLILGKTVCVDFSGKTIRGKAIMIDENANLILETSDGTLTIQSGEARLIKQ